jgi:3-oxoacyl-[acyl-carrier-protein] synthase-3
VIYSRIAGTGSYLPEKILSNHDLEQMVETSDQWITERTGIKKRHIVADDETTTELAFNAAKKAIEAASISAEEIDLIIVATTTPTRVFPSTASLVQEKLNILNNCPAFDI